VAGCAPAITADAVIVIFGAAVRPDGAPSATLRGRVAAAVDLGTRFADPLYLPTGAKGRRGASEASVMARLLRQSGVSPERILLEETGTDTLSSVRAVARLLAGGIPVHVAPVYVAPVYVATSGYHLLRCRLLLRLAGIAAFACPPPPASTGFRQRWYWRLREAAAIPYDAILGLLLCLRGRW
jgi:uncharacterized SAM-binding protein YcdF (DUF218 family)